MFSHRPKQQKLREPRLYNRQIEDPIFQKFSKKHPRDSLVEYVQIHLIFSVYFISLTKEKFLFFSQPLLGISQPEKLNDYSFHENIFCRLIQKPLKKWSLLKEFQLFRFLFGPTNRGVFIFSSRRHSMVLKIESQAEENSFSPSHL